MRFGWRKTLMAAAVFALAAGAAVAALTAEERLGVEEIRQGGVEVQAAGDSLMANPGLEPDLHDEARNIRECGARIEALANAILGEE